MSVERLKLLEGRVDVMQREIQQVLGVVKKDLEEFMGSVVQALQAYDARLDVLEAANRNPAPTVERSNEGKEL